MDNSSNVRVKISTRMVGLVCVLAGSLLASEPGGASPKMSARPAAAGQSEADGRIELDGQETGVEAVGLSIGKPISTPEGTSSPDSELVASCPLTAIAFDGSTSGNGRAPISTFRFIRGHYLIKATELAAAGLTNGSAITKVGWHYATAPGVAASAPLIVYMQNTADTTNTKSTTWSTAITGMTVVHNATTALPNSTTPFDPSRTPVGVSMWRTIGGSTRALSVRGGPFLATPPDWPLGWHRHRATRRLPRPLRSATSDRKPA